MVAVTPGSVITGLNPTVVNPSDPFPLFVIQAVIIVGLCYILHLGLRKLKQPRVISEVIAGIILGPSVMGRIPGFATTIFNPAGLPYLNLVSTLGLVLFLFLVGLELDPALVIKRARFALGISFAGMALPLGVGAAVSYVLFEELGPNTTVGFGEFLLFCGVAMAITAFPVLARILAEQKLLTTKVGFLTICAGAVGDIVAWILLALVVSIINSASKITPLYVVLLSIAWILVLIFIFRITKSQDEPSQTMMAFTLALVMVSAFVTDIIGVHSIFGAFLVGLIIPNDTGFADGVTKRIEDLVSVIFLPIYFALSGLKTQVGLLDNGRIWGLVILTTVVACFGKIAGCSVAARIQGMEWRESFAIGVLMNCKGLIELIVLNIGYDAGVINDKVFVIMVAMCLITTCMTTPAVSWIYPVHYQRAAALRALAKERKSNGDIERASSADDIGKAQKGFMLCLEKIHHLPALMTFLEMLHHASPTIEDAGSQSNSHSSLTVPGSQAPFVSPTVGEITNVPDILALRLLHLTERSSSVLLAATERAEVLRRDTLMTVFQAFAKLNSIPLRPLMTLSTDPDDFAQSIYDEAIESGTGTIIVPWNSTSLPDPPLSIIGDGQSPVLSRPLVTSNTQLVSRLLNVTSNKGLVTAVFVDREFGGSGHFLNIMIPLYGSQDDEEALKLASAMSHNRICNILIVRIEAAKKVLNEKDTTVVQVDSDSQSMDYPIEEVPDLPEDNQVLIQSYFPHRCFPLGDRRLNNKKTSNNGSVEVGLGIFVHVVPTLQDSIGLAKTVLGSRDLVVMGRGQTTKSKRHTLVADPGQLQQQQPLSNYGTSTGVQIGGHSSKNPGLHLSQLPTGFTISSSNTPTHPIDNPLGDSGLRPRHHLKPQPSSRDLHHSFLTVSTILGIGAQNFLSSEVACCLLVVQSGVRHAPMAGSQLHSPGIEFSRVPSTTVSSVLPVPPPLSTPRGQPPHQQHQPHQQQRPLGFESEHAPAHYIQLITFHLNESVPFSSSYTDPEIRNKLEGQVQITVFAALLKVFCSGLQALEIRGFGTLQPERPLPGVKAFGRFYRSQQQAQQRAIDYAVASLLKRAASTASVTESLSSPTSLDIALVGSILGDTELNKNSTGKKRGLRFISISHLLISHLLGMSSFTAEAIVESFSGKDSILEDIDIQCCGGFPSEQVHTLLGLLPTLRSLDIR
ncbi:K(+)/H(+) antiporter [Gryganskiella cystojenkinii]|nr:K(+)/H(+) antiporter [Gryganskiella cystojenkinii]